MPLLDSAGLLFGGAPFTRQDAAAAGIPAHRLERMARQGLVRRMLRGVYVDPLVPDTLELRAAALGRIAPPDAVICRRTAAWLYGVDTLALSEHSVLPYVDSVVPSKRRALRRGETSPHSQTLLPGDVTRVREVRVTTPAATAVHLARHLERPFALSAVDAMLRAEMLTLEAFRAAVARYPHHPGIVLARDIARFADPAAESPGESWLRLRIIDAGFPRPVCQYVVNDGDRHFRLDLGFVVRTANGRRLGLEYDSDEWHSGLDRDRIDTARRTRLAELGWDVLPVRRGDVWGRDPRLELAVGEMLEIEPRLPRLW
jgi:Transcriptional regulator, AbiEi antitoxin/AbiEi antitoxin C-terminal domain